jgi:hypothetical protein
LPFGKFSAKVKIKNGKWILDSLLFDPLNCHPELVSGSVFKLVATGHLDIVIY